MKKRGPFSSYRRKPARPPTRPSPSAPYDDSGEFLPGETDSKRTTSHPVYDPSALEDVEMLEHLQTSNLPGAHFALGPNREPVFVETDAIMALQDASREYQQQERKDASQLRRPGERGMSRSQRIATDIAMSTIPSGSRNANPPPIQITPEALDALRGAYGEYMEDMDKMIWVHLDQSGEPVRMSRRAYEEYKNLKRWPKK